MSAAVQSIPTSDDVTKLSPKYPDATQAGFKIVADKYGRAGLWRIADDGERLVSGGVWVPGQARDNDSLGWCNVIEYVDADGSRGTWLMPKTMLAGDKTEAIRELLNRGIFIVTGNKPKSDLFDYINHGGAKRFTTVERTGWHLDSFVLNDRVIGNGHYILKNPKPAPQQMGTLDSWRTEIAGRCVGNSRLILFVSGAFAGPLMAIAGVENGGIHCHGESSTGKSKGLVVASTVHNTEVNSWRTTDNGLEGTAAMNSDLCLLLDELGECDPRAVNVIVYMLGNGQGKTRARRDGSSRMAEKFNSLPLSTGEPKISEYIASAQINIKAGQEVRIADVPADAGKGMGLFENIHDSPNPQEFADTLSRLAKGHNGHAGHAFIEYVCKNRKHCKSEIESITKQFFQCLKIADESGQVHRVAKRFALIAAAGELATDKGITGWHKGDALDAAVTCFKAWRKSWAPAGSREEQKAIGQVVSFIQQHQSRFEKLLSDSPPPINRAGYVDKGEFWIFPKVFSAEVCKGLSVQTVTNALMKHDCIVQDTGSRRQARRSVYGKRPRFYVISDRILEIGAEESGT